MKYKLEIPLGIISSLGKHQEIQNVVGKKKKKVMWDISQGNTI